jgi:hypothetical protein
MKRTILTLILALFAGTAQATDATVYTGGDEQRVIGLTMNFVDEDADIVVRVRNEAELEGEGLRSAVEFQTSDGRAYVGSGISHEWETGRGSMEFFAGAQAEDDADEVRVVLEGYVRLTPGSQRNEDIGVRVGLRF